MLVDTQGNPLSVPITQSVTEGYEPSWGYAQWGNGNGAIAWSWADIQWLRRDPTVSLGLKMLKAPLEKVDWTVKSESSEVAAFVDSTLKRVWKRAITKVLRAIDYGFMGAEILFEEAVNGTLEFKDLRDFSPYDSRVWTRGKVFECMKVSSIRDGGGIGIKWVYNPRAFWFVYDREYGSWYGRSQLVNVWSAWNEKSGVDGALEIRKQLFYKNAFRGDIFRHPVTVVKNPGGQDIYTREWARDVVTAKKSGMVLTLPNTRDEKGEYQYQWEDSKVTLQGYEGIIEYPKQLDIDIMRGLGIPDDVLTGDAGTGTYGGRKVSERAFYVSLETLLTRVMACVEEQIVKPLVRFNYGQDVPFEVETAPLVDIQAKADGNAPQGPGPMGGATGAGVNSVGGDPGSDPSGDKPVNRQMPARTDDAMIPTEGAVGRQMSHRMAGFKEEDHPRAEDGKFGSGGGGGGKGKKKANIAKKTDKTTEKKRELPPETDFSNTSKLYGIDEYSTRGTPIRIFGAGKRPLSAYEKSEINSALNRLADASSGFDPSPARVYPAVGADGEGDVSITKGKDGSVKFSVTGKAFSLDSTVRLGTDGPEIVVSNLNVKSPRAGQIILSRQISKAAEAGFNHVKFQNPKNPSELAQMGFDAKLGADVSKSLPPDIAGAKTVSELVSTPAGEKWWKENNPPVTMTFDVRKGSGSFSKLRKHLESQHKDAIKSGDGQGMSIYGVPVDDREWCMNAFSESDAAMSLGRPSDADSRRIANKSEYEQYKQTVMEILRTKISK